MPEHFFYDPIKRAIDVVTSMVLLVMLAPVWLIVAGMICLDGGPVFYYQWRVGLGGGTFKMWKFRSMVPNAQEYLEQILQDDDAKKEEWEIWRKLVDDPRITVIGRWLRRLSIDELPQLWNVLKGEMSLVGPRPILADELSLWGTSVDAYYSVRPGITGLWQVSGRNLLSYEQRIQLDLRYIRQRSWWLDTVITLQTVGVVLMAVGAR